MTIFTYSSTKETLQFFGGLIINLAMQHQDLRLTNAKVSIYKKTNTHDQSVFCWCFHFITIDLNVCAEYPIIVILIKYFFNIWRSTDMWKDPLNETFCCSRMRLLLWHLSGVLKCWVIWREKVQRKLYAIPKLLHDDSTADIDAQTVPCTGVLKSIFLGGRRGRIYFCHLTSLIWYLWYAWYF